MKVFADARAGLPLSPAQRAFLKLLEGFAAAAFVAILPLLSQMLAGQSFASINWAQDLKTGAGAFVVAFLLAASKYYKAHGDAAIGSALDTAASDVSKFAGLPNDLKIEPPVSGAPLDVPGGDGGAAPQVPVIDLPPDQPVQPLMLND